MGTTWQLDGSLIVACNCDYGCPCNVNGRPTTGSCEGGWTWHVDSGHLGGTAVDGLNFSIFAAWPGAIHEGGGRAEAYIDERAGESQKAALTELMWGRMGGPWEIFITTYALSGPVSAPYQVRVDGDHTNVRIGDAVDLQMTTIKNPVTGNPAHPRLLMPEGMLTKDIGLFASERFTVKGSVQYDHSGRYAALGSFSGGAAS